DAVKEAFKNSPVKNPNNETGINLHINIDEAVPYVLRLNIWDGFKQYKTDWFGSASDRANPLVIKAKNMAFRYCIFTHELGGIATDAIGIADLPGD
ncbi:MAG: hypothetical protein GWN00_09050, partial [Aliifodinibius sp.]|nr:hypothetical protein [Fodinibius sp.]NIY24943.1 hypothetical protein [Fodinibius sp.]